MPRPAALTRDLRAEYMDASYHDSPGCSCRVLPATASAPAELIVCSSCLRHEAEEERARENRRALIGCASAVQFGLKG